ncbi:MAG: 1-deoxy-D-xylulose-5-phosphate synthase [Chloroflexota bacterium]
MADILERISGPEDLKRLEPRQLDGLAAELRHTIIRTVAETGGHLASSLGVVELTIALHRVFDSPRDKIIWDVGHQSYAHKLLTGRLARFRTLRQYGGVSGFPKRSESAHDVFETGHSSTSISAALGMAIARDMAGGDGKVVAVIGDGSLTGGMAFEGLNQAGQLGSDLIVVLNDNSMSISRNVGALSDYLSRLRVAPRYSRLKADIQGAVRRIPRVGPRVARMLERVKDSVRYLMVPGGIFEELGFTYLGPINGHNIGLLEQVLGNAKLMKGPVLVHVATQKGRGYSHAEQDPSLFHGPGPFEIETGAMRKKSAVPSCSSVFGQELCQLAADDDRIVAITAAMAEGTGLVQFAERFPRRLFDVGIAEQHAVTFAAGLAAAGLRPVVAVYSTFLQRGFDQVLHDVCLQRLPVTLALDRAGIVGEDGETHQGLYDFAYLRVMPNITVMAPADEHELRAMLRFALTVDGPVSLRYPRGSVVGRPGTPPAIVAGRSQTIRHGDDLAIIAIGNMVGPAAEAADALAGEGIGARVVNARFVKPLDRDAVIAAARQTGRILTVEEHVHPGGFGSAVLEVLSDAGLTGPAGPRVHCLAVPDAVVPHGPAAFFREQFGLTASGIAAAARELMRP